MSQPTGPVASAETTVPTENPVPTDTPVPPENPVPTRTTPDHEDFDVRTDLFAHHSATALAYAAEYHDRESAGAERLPVGQALGLVMERYKLSESEAFAQWHHGHVDCQYVLLATHSRNSESTTV